MKNEHLNNEVLLVWYSDVRSSNGGLTTRQNLVLYSNGIQKSPFGDSTTFEYWTSLVFKSPLFFKSLLSLPFAYFFRSGFLVETSVLILKYSGDLKSGPFYLKPFEI